MPFPNTWTEELITEWLLLEGFLVEANLPVATGGPGGRKEADVVGAKIEDGVLKILHIETGPLSGGKNDIERINNKFSPKVLDNIMNHFKQKLSYESDNVEFKKLFIADHWSKPVEEGLVSNGVPVERLPNFICEKVLPTIKNWKKNPPHQPKGRDTVTLPNSYWLLQVVDYLKHMGLLKC